MAEPSPERIVVIDMGSNSFRLVAYSFDSLGRWWRRTDEIHDAVRVGAGLASTGRLDREHAERAVAVMDVYAHFCRASGIEAGRVHAVATSAIRDAQNGAELVSAVASRTGWDVRVLSVEEEAHYGYLAAVNSTTLDDGAVLDLGGGSLQLVHVDHRRSRACASWPLGTVRMTEQFLTEKPATAKQRGALSRHVAEQLAQAPWLAQTGGRIVGLGGTVRNLAAAAAHAAGKPSIGVQGAQLERGALEQLIERLAARPASRRAEVPGIKPERAGIILAGAIVVAAVMDAGVFSALEVTHAGLREGIFLASFLGDRDPPLFDDVRRESVLNLARQYHDDLGHSEHVAALAAQLLGSLDGLGPTSADMDVPTLLWAGGMLHDVGMAIDYDDHHKHSRYLVLAAGLPGFSQREQAIIAQAVRYHRKGTPDLGYLSPLCEKGDEALVTQLAALLRLAEHLDRARDGSVRRAGFGRPDAGEPLTLEVDGDSALTRWGAERQSELFCAAFGRPLVVREPDQHLHFKGDV